MNPSPSAEQAPTRRQWLMAGAGALAAAAPAVPAFAADTPSVPSPLVTSTSGSIPLVAPRTEFVYEAVADLEPSMDLGHGPLGERHMVPIIGGTFEGPGLKGRVLRGGADRQLLRADGVRMLDALYEMQTDDGAILTVHNQVLTRVDAAGKPYRFSHITITAPQGPYDWLNQHVYVGTLNSLQPARHAVVIRAWRLV